MNAPRAPTEEPWLGLLSYTSEHQELFFGRGKETEVLLRMIRREPLTTLFGPSGTGKTSLLNAAIAPALTKEDFLPVYIRLDHNPGSAAADRQIRARIEKEVQSRGLDPSSFAPAASGESVWEYLHRVELWDAENNPITPVLFFDQFEEAFTIGAALPETASFFTDLADLVENFTPRSVRDRLEAGGSGLSYPQMRRYKIVLSLREDFVHKLDGLRRLMPSIMQNRFALTRMTTTQAMEAVLKPGAGLVTVDVAGEIVSFVAGGPSAGDGDVEVEPALLSVVCRELNFRRITENAPVITSQHVATSSADVLQDFYERSFDGVPIEARYFVEDRLLTGSGFRSTAPEEDAIKAGVSAEVIRLLEDRRIIRREQRLKIAHVELTHDLLTRVVRDSRDARHERLRLEEEGREQREREAKLLREKEEQEAKLRVSRRLTIVMATAALLCLVFGAIAMIALFEARRAEREARISQARSRIASVNATTSWFEGKKALLRAAKASFEATTSWFRATKSDQNARGALDQAWKSEQNAQQAAHQAKSALKDARSNLLRFYEERAGTAYRSGDTLQAWLYTIEVLSTATDTTTPLQVSLGRLLLPEIRPGYDKERSEYWNATVGANIRSIAFTPDGQSIVDGSFVNPVEADEIRLWGKKPVGWKTSTKSGVWEVAVSPDGQTLATASAITADNKDGALDLWTMTGSIICTYAPLRREGRPPEDEWPLSIDGVAFSAAGNRVASFDSDGSIQFWSSEEPCAPIGAPITTADADRIQRIAFSADGRILAAAANKRVILWNVSKPESPELLYEIDPADHPVRSVAFNTPSGSRVPDALAAGFDDDGLCWWDLAEAPPRGTCPAQHVGPTWSVSISPDRTMVASGHTDNTFRIWDFASGRLLAVIPTDSPVNSVAFSRSGDAVAFGTGYGTVRRLSFDGRFWDSGHDLAELIRDPWSKRNQDAVAEWKAQSLSLGYRFVATNLEEADPDAIANAASTLFVWEDSDSTGVELTADNTLLFANPAAKDQHAPRWDRGELLMVPDKVKGAAAAAFLKEGVAPPFTVEFEYLIRNDDTGGWDGVPADGISFMFLTNAAEYEEGEPSGGSARGTIPGSGYAVHFQLFGTSAHDRNIFLQDGSKSSGRPLTDAEHLAVVPASLLSGLPDIFSDGTWRKVRISVTESSVDVNYSGFDVIKWKAKDQENLNMMFRGIGFGAASGGADAEHRIRRVKITTPKAGR